MNEPYDHSRHNYVRKIEQLRKAGKLDGAPGTVNDLAVQHDDDCKVLLGQGYCDCDPDIIWQGRKLRLN